MARTSPSDVARAFFQNVARAKSPDLIYYIHGQESYLLDRALDALIKLAAPDGINDFNYDAFHAKELSGDQLRSTVETLPFMSARRIVVVRDLQEMDLKQFQVMDDYFLDPSPSTCLILHAMTAQKTPDGRSSIIKKLKKAATVGEFATFKENDAEDFVAKQARARQMRLDEDATAYLMQAVGLSLADLDLALTKIDLYLGTSKSVRQVALKEITPIIAETRSHTVFELTDALGAKNLEEAMHIFDRMVVEGAAPIMINQMIARHFRILARLHDPAIRNAGRNEKAKAAGVAPFFLNNYQRDASRFSAVRIHHILEHLVDVDHALKSSRLDDRVHLEKLIMQIVL